MKPGVENWEPQGGPMNDTLGGNRAFISHGKALPVGADSRAVLPVPKTTGDVNDSAPAPTWDQEWAVWIGLILILLLSLAAGYLLWAKVASTWPFSQ